MWKVWTWSEALLLVVSLVIQGVMHLRVWESWCGEAYEVWVAGVRGEWVHTCGAAALHHDRQYKGALRRFGTKLGLSPA